MASPVGTPVLTRTASGTSATSAYGTGQTKTAGDILVACVSTEATVTTSITTPSGWTLLCGGTVLSSGTSSFTCVGVYGKVAVGSDAAPTFTVGATGITEITLHELSGAGLTPVTSGTATGTSGTSLTPVTSGNVTSANSVGISVVGNKHASNTDVYTVGSGWTSFNDGGTSGVGNGASDYISNPTNGSTLSEIMTFTRTFTSAAAIVAVFGPTVFSGSPTQNVAFQATAADAGPVLVASYPVFDTTVDAVSLVSPSITVANGDVLVIKGLTSDASLTFGSPSGGSQTYTSQYSLFTAVFTGVQIWTATISGSPGTVTVTVPVSGTSHTHGMVVEHWTNAAVAATPAIGHAQSASGTPSATITTTVPQSRVSWVNGDWNAVTGARTYVTSSQTPVEESSQQSDAHYVGDWAWQPCVSAASQTFGLSAPAAQKWTLAGIEILPLQTAFSGSSSQNVAFGESAAGEHIGAGAASQVAAFAVSAVAHKVVAVAATATVALADSVVSHAARIGTPSQAVAFSDSVVTKPVRKGTPSQAVALAGSVGSVKHIGTGASSLNLAFSLSEISQNFVTLPVAFGTSAVGRSARNGVASLALALADSAAGKPVRKGSPAAASVAFADSATGIRHSIGAVSRAVAFSESAAGIHNGSGSPSQPVAFSGSISGNHIGTGSVSQAVAFGLFSAEQNFVSVPVAFDISVFGRRINFGFVTASIALGNSSAGIKQTNGVGFRAVALGDSAAGGGQRAGSASQAIVLGESAMGSSIRIGTAFVPVAFSTIAQVNEPNLVTVNAEFDVTVLGFSVRNGSVVATVALGNSAVGVKSGRGLVTASFVLSGSMVTSRLSSGNVIGQISFGELASGSRIGAGAASRVVALLAQSAGVHNGSGLVTVPVHFGDTSISGANNFQGSPQINMDFGVSAIGQKRGRGLAAIPVALSRSATGRRISAGLASTAFALGSSSQGTRIQMGEASVTVALHTVRSGHRTGSGLVVLPVELLANVIHRSIDLPGMDLEGILVPEPLLSGVLLFSGPTGILLTQEETP